MSGPTSIRYGLNRTLGLAIATIAIVALIGSGVVFAALGQVSRATAARHRSDDIITGLDAFRTAMLNQQTGVRGYLLTGRADSLVPYEAGRTALNTAIAGLEADVADDPAQRVLLRQAEDAARDWQMTIGSVIAGQEAGSATSEHARALETGLTGKAEFDRFRGKLGVIEAKQRRADLEANRTVRIANREAILALWASALLTLFICVGVGLAINRLIASPLSLLAATMTRLVNRDTSVAVPALRQRNEVGDMARAVQVFKNSLIELDRTSLLRVTADTLPALVGYVDAQGRIGFINDEFTRWFDFGIGDVAEVQGRALDEVFPEGRFPGAGERLDQALAGQEVRFALGIGSKDGREREVEAYFRPHRAPDGRVLGVVTLFTDVSDRKDVDRQLRVQSRELQRSNEELEQFAYVASHDLKAPLRGIENLASWIEEDLAEALSGETRTNMDLLRSRVKRLESLLDDLLAYSRAGRDNTVVRVMDTRAAVDELATLMSPPEGFRIEGSARLPTLSTSHAALTQVLQNLIGNAIKHHPDPAHGHVWVDATREGPFWEFTVADDGPGVPEPFRERVFGMFQTLRPRDEVEGSGMGLAIVKKLVERQAGTVWLSDRPQGGLVVHFTWPAPPGRD